MKNKKNKKKNKKKKKNQFMKNVINFFKIRSSFKMMKYKITNLKIIIFQFKNNNNLCQKYYPIKIFQTKDQLKQKMKFNSF